MNKKEKQERREAMKKLDDEAVAPDYSKGVLSGEHQRSPYQELLYAMFLKDWGAGAIRRLKRGEHR